MSELTLTDQFTNIFNSKKAASNELNSFQNSSFEKFQALGLPHRKSEAYKYTQIARILDKNFTGASVVKSTNWSSEEIKNSFYTVEDANHLVFVNGSWSKELSVIKSDSGKLEIKEIGASDLLGKVSNSEQDAFAQLNGANFSSGLFLKATKNSENIPTFIYHFLDAEETTISFPRILIDAELGSNTNIYEKTFVKGDAPTLVVGMLESKVSANAEVRFSKLQQYPKNVFAVEAIYGSQDKDSRFYTNTYSFSGAVIRNNIVIDIDGENCEGHMNGLYLLSGDTHVDNNTSVDHKKPNSFSNELYKGVLDENSRGVFNGKIYVRPDAQKTNAFQSNNNIILSDSATVNTKPQLEIWADDVKCSHGCTTGQLDEDAIFYLRARGISKSRAKALMLNAFAVETLEEVKEDLVKEEIENIILNKLG